MRTKKLGALLAMLILAVSLTGCSGKEEVGENGGSDDVKTEAVTPSNKTSDKTVAPNTPAQGGEVASPSGSNLSDQEFLDTVRELVKVIQGMKGMSDEDSRKELGKVLELSAKLKGFDDTRAKELLNSEPELKAALENLDSMSK